MFKKISYIYVTDKKNVNQYFSIKLNMQHIENKFNALKLNALKFNVLC